MNAGYLVAKIKARLRRSARQVVQGLGVMPTPLVCENAVLWGQERGYKTQRIHAPFVLDFPIPDCILEKPRLRALFQVGLGYSSQHLVTFPDAMVKGHRGMITFDNNCYIAESHWRSSNVYGSPIYRNEWPMSKARKLSGDWYCLMGHWGSNYNHWLWDELPRLFSALPYLPSELRFIVADDMTDAQRDSLHFLGISPERCVRQSFHGQTKVERLWFATPLGHSDQASTAPDVAFRIRQAFLEKCGAHTSVGRRRFFISRAKAKYRRLLNENEIMLQISKYGFECVQAENLTFKQQVRLFSEAEVILGQHGAGLTNMLFAPLHCKILEIHGPEVTRCHYLMMASILGHAYDCFVGQVPETSKTPTKEPDFLVDLISFKSWLKNALI